MRTIKLTERQRDALYSVIKQYAEGIASNGYFITSKGRKFKDEESYKLLELLE